MRNTLSRSPLRRLTIGSMVGRVPDTTFSYLRQRRWVRRFLLSIWLRIFSDATTRSFMSAMKILRQMLSSELYADSQDVINTELEEIRTEHREYVTKRIMGYSPLRIWRPVILLVSGILLSVTILKLLF